MKFLQCRAVPCPSQLFILTSTWCRKLSWNYASDGVMIIFTTVHYLNVGEWTVKRRCRNMQLCANNSRTMTKNKKNIRKSDIAYTYFANPSRHSASSSSSSTQFHCARVLLVTFNVIKYMQRSQSSKQYVLFLLRNLTYGAVQIGLTELTTHNLSHPRWKI